MDEPTGVSIRANPDAQLSPEQLQILAELLVRRRRELVDALTALEQHITRRQDCSVADAAEAASLREEAARAAGIAAGHRQTIADIDHALRRLADASYGVSETTGEPIGYARLLLVPWARSGTQG